MNGKPIFSPLYLSICFVIKFKLFCISYNTENIIYLSPRFYLVAYDYLLYFILYHLLRVFLYVMVTSDDADVVFSFISICFGSCTSCLEISGFPMSEREPFSATKKKVNLLL